MNGIEKFKNDLEKNLNDPVVKKQTIENIMESKNPKIKNLLNKNIDFKPLENIIIEYILALKDNKDYENKQFEIQWVALNVFCPKELIDWIQDRNDLNARSF